MGLTTIQDFVVDTLIEKQSITKEKLSNALDQILSSEGIDKFLGLLIQGVQVKSEVENNESTSKYKISLLSIESDWSSKVKAIKFIRDRFSTGLKGAKDLVDAIPVDLPFVMSHKEACSIGRELTELGVKTAITFY